MRAASCLLVLLTLTGCSLQKMALRGATPIFQNSSRDVLREGNWEFFRVATPGNLKFLELLWQQDQDNLEMLSVLIKSYSGYAFGVHETLTLEDDLLGSDESQAKKDSIYFYTRALDYGLLYLKKRGITNDDLLGSEEKLQKKLKSLDDEDTIALLYTAQSWGSLINLQKDNIALISQVPKVKILFDRVCSIEPDIDHNVCDIFYAQYEVSRPKMLGGDPVKGEQLFHEAIKKYPHNLLIRLSYIQYALVPAMDGEKYEKVASELRKEFASFSDLNRDNLENVSPYKDATELNLFNAIAKKRFEIIEKHKKKIF